MFALPVSGARVALKIPDGADDLRLVEAGGEATEVAADWLDGLAGGALAARELAVADFEWLLLQARAARLGRTIDLGFACSHCRGRGEFAIDVAECLEAATPKPVPGVADDPGRPGWRRLGEASFRLPSVADQIAATASARPELRMAELCLDATARRAPHRARVERAMARLAPLISRVFPGLCPSCGAAVEIAFAVARVVMVEMRRAAAAAHDEIDLIARAYHWPEADILALPQPRRRAYAERIRSAGLRAA
jgi:hypothetical protein